MNQFPVVGDQLVVGNVPLRRLAARVGSTPFFAYDRRLIADRVALLRAHLPAEIHLHYALKANPMPALVQHLASLVDGLDVASSREMRVALDTGIDPGTISFAGPGKTDAELACAVAAGIVINVESGRELAAIQRAAEAFAILPKVAIRVNPDFELRGSSMKMGGGAKQFGVDAESVPDLLRAVTVAGLDFVGFHIFSGSQNLNAEAIIDAQEKTFELATRLAAYAPCPVRLLNIGGGFGIPYFPGDKPLAVARIGEYLKKRLPEVTAELPGVQLVMEMGRYLVAEAGVYVCRVTDRKISRGQVFLVTDGGMHHHLAASGNLGQVIRKNYPVCIGTRMHSSECETVSVVGPLCTPLDLLADRMDLPHAEIGDLVVIFQSGAYGLTASPSNFLGHPEALEVLL